MINLKNKHSQEETGGDCVVMCTVLYKKCKNMKVERAHSRDQARSRAGAGAGRSGWTNTSEDKHTLTKSRRRAPPPLHTICYTYYI